MIIIGIIYIIGLACLLEWMFPVVKQRTSIAVITILQCSILCITSYFHVDIVGWFAMLLILNCYFLFYASTYEFFKRFVLLEIIYFVGTSLIAWNTSWYVFPIPFFCALYITMLYLKQRLFSIHCLGILFFSITFFMIGLNQYAWLMNICTLAIIILLEDTYQRNMQVFDKNTTDFQNHIMLHHYDEVKSVYLNMRGWRHDYHNHIQSMKAYLSLKQYSQLSNYLNELETDLKQVDQMVKSGNLMVDAILNSKLSLAKEHHIEVSCKAITPEKISITDIDICVIIGNLMDNAIEACDKIDSSNRWIRIYTDIVHQQFYLSITNSALEELSDDQKHYISQKRGNHGHGMKRVKLTVDKYDGYLNLKNEPGVFVSEIMIPII